MGVSCVGKTTIGAKLSELLDVRMFDLDEEIERYFQTSIERIQDRFRTIHSICNEAAKALGNWKKTTYAYRAELLFVFKAW